jgi:hypothetical protein
MCYYMIHIIKGLYYITLATLLGTCRPANEGSNERLPFAPGFALSFDDRFIDEWFSLQLLFRQYDAQSTFYLTQPDSLTKAEVYKLKQLVEDGHEVGCHGSLHLNATRYLLTHSRDSYLAVEIDPAQRSLHRMGFTALTFAYPFGADNWYVNQPLQQRFTLLRDTYSLSRSLTDLHGNQVITEADPIYFRLGQGPRVCALGIDADRKISESELKKGLLRAKEQGEVLLLYAHCPVRNLDPNQPEKMKVRIELLTFLFKTARELGLRSYKMSQLTTIH